MLFRHTQPFSYTNRANLDVDTITECFLTAISLYPLPYIKNRSSGLLEMEIPANHDQTSHKKDRDFDEQSSTHSIIKPAILYWGTPVVLVTTLNEDGSPNIAPISSAFWLGTFCVLGIAKHSKTTVNLLRTKQCVLNLPSEDGAHYVNAVARTTGSDPVPEMKVKLGYTHLKDKFSAASLTPQDSDLVAPPRIKQCPVQMEAEYISELDMGFALAIQVVVQRVHVIDELRLSGYANRINTDLWKPMIMSFQKLFGLRNGELVDSRLAKIDEELYRK